MYKLQEKIANLTMFDLLPFNQGAQKETREFLLKIVEILLDYIELCNNQNEHVLEYHQPEKLKELFDMQLPDEGMTLQHLITDCATVLKYGVKTGKTYFQQFNLSLKAKINFFDLIIPFNSFNNFTTIKI